MLIRIKFRDMPLKQKLYLCIILLVIMPLLLAGLYLNRHFTRLTLSNSSDIALQTLKQTKQNFDALIADTDDLSLRMMSNLQIQRFLKEEYENTPEYELHYKEIFAWLTDLIGSKAHYDTLGIISGGRVVYQMGTLDSGVNEDHIRTAEDLKGRLYWTSENERIYAYRRIMDFAKYGNDLGVIKMNVSEEAIYHFYKDINTYDGSQTYLIDASGKVLSSTDKNEIGRTYGQHEDLKQRIADRNEGYFGMTVGSKNNIVLFYRISGPNWHVVQTIPESSFTLLKTTLNTVLLIAIALCALFGFLFSLVQHQYWIKPLGRLRAEMAKLRTGNFNISLNDPSKDEIGEIHQGFMRMAGQLKRTIEEEYVGRIRRREAELTALQAQINPHFLYNTLDSIHWLAMKHRNYDVSEQIEALSEIFKHVLSKGQPLVAISHELEFLDHYMFIQQAKYGQRIKLRIDADPALLGHQVPKLILQPLVENAILHGLEEKLEGGAIEVRIERVDGNIRMVVADDGLGVDQDRINRMLHGEGECQNVFALRNIDERIKLQYGREYGLTFSSKENEGTVVEMLVPIVDKPEKERKDEAVDRG
ncbi:sensor histidine kinase [Paenibacillaceae bacterium WGS1546]|uniref:cache domain-containing sensor histidine kinase n=1 Tax=Cohnella sp. WGS1546 TaxID=3366810 RepID=UPI00372CEF03